MKDSGKLIVGKRDYFGLTDRDRARENAKTNDGQGNTGVLHYDCGCVDSVAHGANVRRCGEHRVMKSLTGKPISLAA